MFASSRYSAFSRRLLPLAVALLFWGVMVVGGSSRAWAQQRTFTFVNQCNETIWVVSVVCTLMIILVIASIFFATSRF